MLGFLGCRGNGSGDRAVADAAPSASASPAPKEARADAGDADASAKACPGPDAAKVARFTCDRTRIDADVPPLVDPKKTLAPFYDKVTRLARGLRTDHVRIAMYGDSNLTADATTGRLRRQLQARFGDGGHGYVALARPWAWYSHNDVHHDGKWKMPALKQIATSTHRIDDAHYGFANMASECGIPGCAVWVSTDPQKGAPIGWTASRLELYYLRRPDGGRFEIELDGSVVKTIEAKASTFEAAFERFDVPDAHHELKVKTLGHGPVRLYGVALERSSPSITVDSLGTGSLNLEQLSYPKSDTRRAQLERRAYDLVIIHLGTNVFGTDKENKQNAKVFIDELRAALPGLPIMFMSPPDMVEEGQSHSDPRIKTLTRVFREIAAENDAAFWDYRAAMGGKDAILDFMKKGLAAHDKVHLSKLGDELMADRILCAMWDGLADHLEADANAGCAE
ncbi:MAG: hypothetical protein KF819_38310 [Labilithrix sp.]|nr:hypothetical protein [Labilithrix sp.]